MHPRLRPNLLGVLALICALPAQAGRSCEAQPLTAAALEQGMTLAARALAELDASGQQVVVLARAGQDLSRYHLRYSHLGFAYRQPDGSWRVMHKLNHCGTATADVFRQGLGEFFLDDLWRMEAAYAVPTPEVQERLLTLLRNESTAVALHQRPYSIVSYAWGDRYQQSNQWAVETLALAMDRRISNRSQSQAWLRSQDYRPTTLQIGPLTRLGGRISAANVAFDDHPFEKRFSDRIETVTVDSVFDWLERARLAGSPVLLR